ncbi:sulfatase family protein [Galbibacter mesophilus]|uniref:sulfatase family protein n=1 Tax=Galbibacter mesophilus TaxID=379069 RepID=UPI00191CF8E3|nr:sulfatase [Galbibacter mesophilus]MCM5664342.1 sulfatase [Galbibacter mesophilus]
MVALVNGKTVSCLIVFILLNIYGTYGLQKDESIPNVVLILCDDLGYGDLGVYGNKLNKTPAIDKLAKEGIMFTDFYSASSLCTPARAALLTGTYPLRNGMAKNFRGECVIFPVDEMGLHPNEITIPEMLKQKDYKTALIGKWHLGDQKEFLPTRHGFDYFYGLPYSNDTPPGYKYRKEKKLYEHPEIPLLKNEEVIESPVVQETLTKRYTEESVKFIKDNRDKAFFLMLSHTMPHGPLHASKRFQGKSKNGLFGDVVEEIDWSTGEIIQTLEDLGLRENTIVIFTSDNGAPNKPANRSNFPLSGYKGTVAEGGMRVPMIFSWPGHFPKGKKCNELTTMIDIYPTLASITGCDMPSSMVIDGKDIQYLLHNPEKELTSSPYFAYYLLDQLQAIRAGKWKLYLPLKQKKDMWNRNFKEAHLELYNLEEDISETKNVASEYKEVVSKLSVYATIARNWIGDEGYVTPNSRPAGYVPNPQPLKIIRD